MVRLTSVNGTRAETPIPMAALKRLSNRPTVSTTTTLAQPKPQPPRLRAPDHRRRRSSLMLGPSESLQNLHRSRRCPHLFGDGSRFRLRLEPLGVEEQSPRAAIL